eukprot:scaffold158_cov228-Pinguiococcus_pyrenoidosus.AAC.3
MLRLCGSSRRSKTGGSSRGALLDQQRIPVRFFIALLQRQPHLAGLPLDRGLVYGREQRREREHMQLLFFLDRQRRAALRKVHPDGVRVQILHVVKVHDDFHPLPVVVPAVAGDLLAQFGALLLPRAHLLPAQEARLLIAVPNDFLFTGPRAVRVIVRVAALLADVLRQGGLTSRKRLSSLSNEKRHVNGEDSQEKRTGEEEGAEHQKCAN